MKEKINSIINQLSEIRPEDLNNCSVEELAQFQYWLSKHQGAIFVKTVGRLSMQLKRAMEETIKKAE